VNWRGLDEESFGTLAAMVACRDRALTANEWITLARDPEFSLRAFGRVKGFDGKEVSADFERVDATLATEIAAYAREPAAGCPTRWQVVLKYRQAARSTNFELCGLALAMYRPGWDHVCIADTEDRAKYLHERLHYTYERWPTAIRTPNFSAKEKSQLTLTPAGGTCRILSAAAANAGIGQSIDSLHASELGYWRYVHPGEVWSDIYPALASRDHARCVFECTPTDLNSWWHSFYCDAKRGNGRFDAYFTPFWKSRICRRKWPEGAAMHAEEERWLAAYGPQGMTREHLAFRRDALENAPEFRQHPERFAQAYPFDDVSCWLSSASAAIPAHLLDRFDPANLVPWKPPYIEYEAPQQGGLYIIGVDPAGFLARDHAAFHVWMANRHSERQVASYADHVDPNRLAQRLVQVAHRYNDALIVVEANGVGAGTLGALRHHGYPHVYHRGSGQPGWNNNPRTVEEYTGLLIEHLAETEFVIRDADTIDQLRSYGHEKKTEQSDVAEQRQIQGVTKKRGARRERHHWDKVSALLGVIVGLRSRNWPSLGGVYQCEQNRVDPASIEMTCDEWDAYAREYLRRRSTSVTGSGYDRRLTRNHGA
jgi:hypothetical protein